ncbi:MAG: HEAT repeat domain-containing protein [Gammaproteobacteria bacterium]|nr:HEAT repeat domain-containing protein [Gammaproteobacteria bacterium]
MESGWGLITLTSGTGQFALYAGSAAIILLVLLMFQVSMTRLHLIVVRKRRIKIQAVWRDIIGRLLVGEKPECPKIKRRDMFHVLEEFDYVFGIVRGNDVELLRQGFRELKLPVPLNKILKSYNLKKQLFALITLGNIRDASAWDQILKSLSQSQSAVSLTAARSLVLIDPQRAVNEIVPIILKRKDWPWANIAHVLKLAGPKLVCGKLSELILNSNESKQAFLLRLYDVLKCEEEYPITCKVLQQASEDKVASVCLNISQDPNIVYLARDFARHERWHVRMNAAVALGRFGNEEDITILIELMKDSQWWVRYRAAQSLLGMPDMNHGRVQQIRDVLNDGFADDILVQAMNEIDYAK